MRKTVACLGAALWLAFGGCDRDPDGSEETQVVFYSWWSNEDEDEALGALLQDYEDMNPDVEIIDAVAANALTARADLVRDFAEGYPPDTFQLNGGNDLERWFPGASKSKGDNVSPLRPIDDLLGDTGIFERIPPELLAAVSIDGVPYAVPVNVHRTNSLFYNIELLADAEVEVPRTWDELLATCEALEAQSIDCLTLGGTEHDGWGLALFLYENVMVATQGADFFDRFFEGDVEMDDPQLQDYADRVLELWAHVATDDQTSWEDAILRVGRGDAAFTVMGDWAKAILQQKAELEPGVDFGQAPFPGTVGHFVFVTDAFPLPVGAPNPNNAVELLRVFASPEAQERFNRLKGSIPARDDVDLERFDPLGQQMFADFWEPEVVRVIGGKTRRLSQLDPMLQRALAYDQYRGSREYLLHAIRDFYPILSDCRSWPC